MTHDQRSLVASPEQRAAPLEMVFRRKGEMPETFVHDFTGHAEEKWITDNGARMVARAWTDPSFRTRLLADGTAVAKEMGFEFPEHHRQLVVLENATAVHNVIVCMLCSCTAYTIIGAAPDWYKDLDYRTGVVRKCALSSARWVSIRRRVSRFASGTLRPTTATWCYRYSRRQPLAGPNKISPRSLRRIP